PTSILGEASGPLNNSAGLVHNSHEVLLRSDVDSCVLHCVPLPQRRMSRASEPVPLPTLVYPGTRPTGRPQHSVRAQNTGRGRQSHARGTNPKRAAATLSRFPSGTLYTSGVHSRQRVAHNLRVSPWTPSNNTTTTTTTWSGGLQ